MRVTAGGWDAGVAVAYTRLVWNDALAARPAPSPMGRVEQAAALYPTDGTPASASRPDEMARHPGSGSCGLA
jgi:hypothetical protein